MKLTEVAVEGNGVTQAFQIGRFTDGLNLVYGENGAGKSTIRELIAGILHGQQWRANVERNHRCVGSFSIQSGSLEYRAQREFHENGVLGELSIREVLSGEPISVDVSRRLGQLNQELIETAYIFSLKQTRENAKRLASVLNLQLNVARGPSAAGDDAAYLAWKNELASRKSKLATLQQNLKQLENDRARYEQQVHTAEQNRLARLSELDHQIASAKGHLSELDISRKREELSHVDEQIQQLRLLIDSAVKSATYIPNPPNTEPCTALYQRLDEIDHQIRRWRRVQTDIQNQRVRLKDEMMVWNELTLDSQEHPYHTARGILVSLERKVDATEKQLSHLSRPGNAENKSEDSVREIGKLCQQMREDLYGLCTELAHQYKHIRHKAAAAELKQLRRCYTEMGENTERLVQRRDSLVKEIRKLDPAGADAIERADAGFCKCAMHEGYLEARRRHVATAMKFTSPQLTHQVIAPDMTTERAKLDTLLRKRQEIVAFLSDAQNRVAAAQSRYAELLRERESLASKPLYTEFKESVARLDNEIVRANHEIRLLVQSIENEDGFREIPPHPIIVSASSRLCRSTNGDLTQVFLNDTDTICDLQVRDRLGKVLNLSALESDLQDLVYLCLAFSTQAHLKQQGIDCPVVIDDAFLNFRREKVNAVIDLYREEATQNQLILLTQHQYIADRIPGVPVYELPPIGMPSPVSNPDRSPSPYLPYRENYQSRLTTDYLLDSPNYSPSTYPISKYADFGHNTYPETLANLMQPTASNEQVSPIAVQSVGDPLGYVASVDDTTVLDRTDLFNVHQLQALSASSIETVGELLGIDLEHIPPLLRERGIDGEQIDRWQSQAWLLSNVPGLRVIDAKLLVACGISEPEQLATSHSQQMFERIQRFLGTIEGQRFVSAVNSISLQRIDGWYDSLSTTRQRWSRGRQFKRPALYRNRTMNEARNEARSTNRTSQSVRQRASSTLQDNEVTGRPPRPARSPRMNTPDRVRSAPALAPVQAPSNNRQKTTTRNPGKPKLRFFLDLNDHIEAAPSIGPKTAERFEKIGVSTVNQFLKQTAGSMASKLNYKRITAELVHAWQHQARLVCRIPNLRGHDAQLLVACGFTEAEEVATMQPKALFEIIGPFADTKDGLKIIRTGKKPDLAEVTDWIAWAGKTRSLQAA